MLKDKIRSIKYGIKNILDFLPVVWQDRDWDYTYLYKILHAKLRKMEENTGWDFFVGGEKEKKNVTEARMLCERIINENEYWRDRYFENSTSRFWIFLPSQQADRDIERLCMILQKHSQKWWD